MKLNIIYHIYKNSTTLRDSLTSIFNQSDANFELTLINDSASNSVKNIIKEFDFSKLKKITYFKYSQNLGHSISFNQAVETTTSEYVIYVGSNFIPEENFVKTINNIIAEHSQADVISLNPVQNNGTCQTFNKINAKMKLMIGYSMKDKIFSVKFLRDNKITLNENLYSPLLLIYTVLEKFHEWTIVDYKGVQYSRNKIYTYNFYDIFEQNDYLIAHYGNTKFWNANGDLIEYLMIMYVFYVFLIRMFHVYSQRDVRQNAVEKTATWLSKNIPEWRNNKILNSNKSRNSKILKEMAKVKFRARAIAKFIEEHKS